LSLFPRVAPPTIFPWLLFTFQIYKPHGSSTS
jgi:hypothetical protein